MRLRLAFLQRMDDPLQIGPVQSASYVKLLYHCHSSHRNQTNRWDLVVEIPNRILAHHAAISVDAEVWPWCCTSLGQCRAHTEHQAQSKIVVDHDCESETAEIPRTLHQAWKNRHISLFVLPLLDPSFSLRLRRSVNRARLASQHCLQPIWLLHADLIIDRLWASYRDNRRSSLPTVQAKRFRSAIVGLSEGDLHATTHTNHLRNIIHPPIPIRCVDRRSYHSAQHDVCRRRCLHPYYIRYHSNRTHTFHPLAELQDNLVQGQ